MATTVAPIPLATDTGARCRRITAIVGASSGNLVEWYDFYADSFTALYFASAFFPAGDSDYLDFALDEVSYRKPEMY